MKIALAQVQSSKGAINHNIIHHSRFISHASSQQADLIVFPELSVTNYEPNLAERLAVRKEDEIFDPIQKLSDQNNIIVALGMPLKVTDGVQIAMIIFQPNKEPISYSKQMLHADEEPFFVKGHNQVYLELAGEKIAFGICYETMHESHLAQTKRDGANIYIASVAKSQNGVVRANEHYQNMAAQYQLPVLMCNAIGSTDDFVSFGSSGVWLPSSATIKMSRDQEGILFFDTYSHQSKISYI